MNGNYLGQLGHADSTSAANQPLSLTPHSNGRFMIVCVASRLVLAVMPSICSAISHRV